MCRKIYALLFCPQVQTLRDKRVLSLQLFPSAFLEVFITQHHLAGSADATPSGDKSL